MPYWIKRTVFGSFICLLCGSLAAQVNSLWLCLDVNCAKHADMPTEEQQGFAGWTHTEFAIGTASLASGLRYPIGTIVNGGD